MCNTFLTEPEIVWECRSVLRPGKQSPFLAPRACRRRSSTAPSPAQDPAAADRAWPATAAEFARKVLEFPIDPKQAEILAANREESRRVVICCSRQWGKSTTGAIKALHHALTSPGSVTLIASRTLHQATQLLEKATQFARGLQLATRRVPGQTSSLLLPNRSRLIAIPGRPASIRAYSAVSLLIVDEAAYVPDSLYEALRPMLATTNGAIWLLSTPNGQKGFFHREWTDKTQTWRKFSTPANECPRISANFLAEERRKHGPAVFEREYLCKFTSTGDSFFDTISIDASSVPSETQTAPGESYLSTRFYVGFDLGQKLSHSAIVVLEKAHVTTKDRDPVTFAWIQRTEIHLRRAERLPLNLTYVAIAERLRSAIRLLPNAKDVTLVLDATGCGAPFLDILRKDRLGVLQMPVMITGSGLPSMTAGTHRISKTDLMSSLNYVITSPDFKINAPAADHHAVTSELQNIRMLSSANGTTRFTTSEKDDLVMAFALAAWPARKYLAAREAR